MSALPKSISHLHVAISTPMPGNVRAWSITVVILLSGTLFTMKYGHSDFQFYSFETIVLYISFSHHDITERTSSFVCVNTITDELAFSQLSDSS